MVHDGWFWGTLVSTALLVALFLRIMFARTPIPGTGPHPDAPASMHVGRWKGLVYFQFSEPLAVARLSPALARQTAEDLRICADRAEGIVDPSEVRGKGILQEPPRRTAWQRLDESE